LNSIDKITVTTPNSPETQAFISSKSPDFVIARCKFLLKERIFDIASYGTFVFHPGICPEYRNAHGCFWAILNRDYERVGMTMLRIDKGVDTGPIYGYFSYDYNPVKESHVTIQSRVVFENLDAITEKIKEIFQKTATPLTIDKDRKSRVWGQPRLTKWIKWNMNKRLN